MSDDDRQYLELLKLYHSEEKSLEILQKTINKRKANRKKITLATVEYYKRKVDRQPAISSLSAILFPDNKKLGNVPLFKRYVAYLVSSYGASKTSEILGVSRTTLWRYCSS